MTVQFTSTSSASIAPPDENQLIVERRDKLQALRAAGIAFPNDVKPKHRAEALFAHYDLKTKEELEPLAVEVSVAGRMMLKRVMGKASFATLQDASFGPSGGREADRLTMYTLTEDKSSLISRVKTGLSSFKDLKDRKSVV